MLGCGPHVVKMSMSWAPPLDGVLNFNVDGAAKRKSVPGGIGGVLCNSKGEVLIMFSSLLVLWIQLRLRCGLLLRLFTCLFVFINPSLSWKVIRLMLFDGSRRLQEVLGNLVSFLLRLRCCPLRFKWSLFILGVLLMRWPTT